MKKMFTTRLALLIIGVLSIALPSPIAAQQADQALQTALEYLESKRAEYQLTTADVQGYALSSQYSSKKSGVTHVYLNQTHQGREIVGATANANLRKSGELINMHVRFIPDVASKVVNAQASLTAEEAVRQLGDQLSVSVPASLLLLDRVEGPEQAVTFDNEGFAGSPVEVRQVFHFDKNTQKVRLAWEVMFEEIASPHIWNARIDAQTGDILFMKDMVLHCDFGSPALAAEHEHLHYEARTAVSVPEVGAKNASMLTTGATYRVIEMPDESPNHGPHVLVGDPSDPIASPYGWHDLDGEEGSEMTITFGNNVHAYQDTDNDDQSEGDEPDGGSALQFDFPYTSDMSPEEYQDASVVNLFYWNNLMHDVWYQYGFDEASGNFQSNNYDRGGVEGDYVNAQAQDGGGTNNANFFTPVDGNNPRMQMYLWNGGGDPVDLVTVTAPATLEGIYQGLEAGFGPGLPVDDPLTGTLVLPDDGQGNYLACGELLNASEIEGNIALIDRGNCTFVTKVENAQAAGAIAVIICNNSNSDPIAMGGSSPDITIPSLMMYQSDCNLIKMELELGVEVAVSLQSSGPPAGPRDSGFDNGIICHEYGHGISIRLTGGPNASNCLWNDEQMGEGWSDYVGLMLTMKESDVAEQVRGIGTFAIFEPIEGDGIRPAPYTTDMNVNPYTYGDTNDDNLSQPHGVGFVWCSTLWDMTWGLIEEYGFDPDFYYGTGGNNIAMHLVTEGMKLQPCQPGFLDGRDAILLADELLYDGAHQCIIWDAFARRGMGLSATQGDTDDRFDQIEAFDLPNLCKTPETAPTADFMIRGEVACTGFFDFEDLSTDIPQQYLWDFGDGNTSTEINPTHLYTEEGTYEIVLTVTNSLGESSSTKTVVVDFPDTPVAEDVVVCKGQPATITVADNSLDVNWYQGNTLIFQGNELTTSALNQSITFLLETVEKQTTEQVGPETPEIGPGSVQTSDNFNGLTFESYVPMVIESVLVQADSAFNRSIQLLNEEGDLIAVKNVFIPAGINQIELELEIPEPGSYQIGGVELGLYRNLFGGFFPYELPGTMALTGTTGASSFYYYFYNWQVRKADCVSEQIPVNATVVDQPVAEFDYQQAGAQFLFNDLSSDEATSWIWYFGNGSISTEQNPIHWYWEEGTYEVTLIVSNGSCASETFTQTVQVTNVSVSDIEGLQSFELRPTVSDGKFFLSVELDQPKTMQLTVFNAIGQPVYQQGWTQNTFLQESVDISDLAAGMYFVQLNVEGQTAVKRYILTD